MLTFWRHSVFFLFLFFITCSAKIKAQNCTSSYFVKDLRINTPTANFLLPLPGGGTLLGGGSNLSLGAVSLVKTRPNGEIVMHKSLSFSQYSGTVKAVLSPTHKVVLAHGTSLALIDTNGIVEQTVRAVMTVNTTLLIDVKTDSQGNVLVLYADYSGQPDQVTLLKFNPGLTSLLWTQQASFHEGFMRSLTVDGDRVFIVGNYKAAVGDESDGIIFQFRNSDGQYEGVKSYTLDAFLTTFRSMHKTKDGYLLVGFYQPVNTTFGVSTQVVVRLNNLLQPVKAVRFTTLLNIQPLFISPDDNGGYYGCPSTAWPLFFYCSPSDSVLWRRGVSPSRGGGTDQFAHSGGNLYALESGCWSLTKANLNGIVSPSCANAGIAFQTVPLLPALRPKQDLVSGAGAVVVNTMSLPVSDQPFQTIGFCSFTSSCSSVQIIGGNTLCPSGNPVRFTARKNAICSQPVKWQTLSGDANLIPVNDSTVEIRFLQSGTFQLAASISGDCQQLADTVQISVTVVNSVPPLNLGPDKLLCPGNVISLNARKGYASYLWQDGSTDSTFTVTQPGLYHVSVTDACNGMYKDSVLITAAPPIPFDLGPDRTKCNSDTIRLSAPAGFLNYIWSNSYNISSTTSQTVVVYPLADTTYYVKAEKEPGCFAYDTVRVKVNTSPPINLGGDRSFCLGDSAMFNAGNGFHQYKWSNGVATQIIWAKTAGSYSVIATTAEGCKSYDTVEVLQVYSPPQVILDKAPALCFGSVRTLNAGSFSSYSWNTGQTTSSISVSGVGKYSVRVTNDNGCVGGDSMEITTIHPLPSGFLPADTAICSYGSLELKPLINFNRYLWNTGSLQSAIRIEQPGAYWLEVVDQNNCTGRDTITVHPKTCLTGFYAPTAFTPNGDSRNDDFKPLLFGNVKKYQLTIYDRWGGVVFSTTEQFKGWNGKVGGNPQRSDVFVWTCTYQFEGESEKMEKGTITLIR